MTTANDTRALGAALSGPAWSTRTGGAAMHVADRHVERWAPETSATRVRSLRSLGFVDRLVSPWIETAQRSSGLRMFSAMARDGVQERERPAGAPSSWVFPRPWYQDELDWMAAARQAKADTWSSPASAPSALTTRGTYVAPQRPSATAAASGVMPAALYEYVAPSLSIAQPPQASGSWFGDALASASATQAYSPLISLAAVQAAELMARTVAPLATPATSGGAASGPGVLGSQLRNVLTTMLERVSVPSEPSRASLRVPEMVTPPAPRADDLAPTAAGASPLMSPQMQLADQVASDLGVQRAQMAQLQAIAQKAQERELATARAAEIQAYAQRTEAELRQRATPAAPAATPSAPAPAPTSAPASAPAAPSSAAIERAIADSVAQRTAAEAERQRIEERVQQRIAERVAAQRLHEQARSEAAVHARQLFEAQSVAAAPAPVVEAPRPPAEVLAALAALPPQLQGMISEGALTRPGGAAQAIAQVNEALRTAELIARSAATNATFEATRGPRLMMPAGLGGLVTAVERAHQPALAPRALPMTAGVPAPAPTLARAAQAYRVPSLPVIAPVGASAGASTAPGARALGPAPTSALGAAMASAPQALSHVAWADRWLARFAGASAQSLETIAAASSTMPLAHLASAAPQAVFVAPAFFDIERDAAGPTSYVGRGPSAGAPVFAAPSLGAAGVPAGERLPRLIPSAPAPLAPIERFDDAAETPDDVFAQIAASASRRRSAPAPQPVAAAAEDSAPYAMPAERMTYADHIAHAAPAAPAAGLSAQLAASPFAPALRHVLALPSAAPFDVRSLFGGALSATFLAGLLEPEAHEVAVSSPLPAWASWAPAIGDLAELGDDHIDRMVPGFDATYVAPELPSELSPEIAAQLAAAGALEHAGHAAAPSAAPSASAAADLAPLTTLRTALLSWSAEIGASGAVGAPTLTGASIDAATSAIMAAPSQARSILSAMSLPMLGETDPDDIGAWTQPGSIADRAYSYSLAHERSTADLAFDFVPPELVLAARVYGLGPAEAAQAARLALAGPGQLTAMANTVDRTFVHAMAIDAERREGGASTAFGPAASPGTAARGITTAYPTGSGEIAAAMAPARLDGPSLGSAAHSAFGVDRRTPRGAFLWPSAAVAALGLQAAGPDGEQSMSVAALELLAAQAVAEIGTYAALDEGGLGEGASRTAGAFGAGALGAGPLGAGTLATGGIAGAGAGALGDAAFVAPAADAAATATATAAASGAGAMPADKPGAEPSESDVLGAASAMIAPARRARFDALYVALSQSPSGRSWSPAARAARALALAGRGDDAPTSAYERAASVWDVLPVVYATEGMTTQEAVETQAELGANTTRGIAARASLRRPGISSEVSELVMPDSRPGLGGLSARAGEALGSYVTSVNVSAMPTGSLTPSVASSSSGSDTLPIAMRAPTAAQELVRTGRPAGRHGGGESEIPPWFEAAARKMLGERMGTEGISLAELTLINTAPQSQIAASSKTAVASAAPLQADTGNATGGGADNKKGDDVDVDAIADEVYRQILIMMDAARQRNGEP